MNNILWRVSFSRDGGEVPADDWYADVEAPTIAEALAVARRDYPGGRIEGVTAVHTSFALSQTYGGDWDELLEQVLGSESPTPGRWSEQEWLLLKFTTALDSDGRPDPEGTANFHHLQRLWSGIPSVRFDGDCVRVRALGAAPADFIAIVDRYLTVGGPINPATYATVRSELGPSGSATTTTRVAVRPAGSRGDEWRIADCPVDALGDSDRESTAVGNQLPGGFRGDVIVIDSVAGFTAGCSTWSHLFGQKLEQARAAHRGCEHRFRPVWMRLGNYEPPLYKHLSRVTGISIAATSLEDWTCRCGNQPGLGSGFAPCDAVGTEIAPTEADGWISLIRCNDCDLVLDQATFDPTRCTVEAVGIAHRP